MCIIKDSLFYMCIIILYILFYHMCIIKNSLFYMCIIIL